MLSCFAITKIDSDPFCNITIDLSSFYLRSVYVAATLIILSISDEYVWVVSTLILNITPNYQY